MAATGLLGINPYQKGLNLDITSKPVNYGIQLRQKEEAKNEALDKYFMDMDKNVNYAGVRSIDQNAVLQKLAENRKLFFENKDALRNPSKYGTEIYNKYMNNYADAQNIINKSKETVATLKAAQALQNAAKARGEIVDDNVLHGIADMEYSVADPRHKLFDISQFSSYKPFNAIDYKNQLRNVTKNPGAIEIKPLDNMTQATFTTYDPDLQELLSISNQQMKTKGHQLYANELLNNPTEVNRLGKIYKAKVKEDMPLTPEAIHYAFTLSEAPSETKMTGERESMAYQNYKFNRAERGKNARAALVASAGDISKEIDEKIRNTGTGKFFPDKADNEIVNLDPSVEKLYIKTEKVPADPVAYKNQKENEQRIKEGKKPKIVDKINVTLKPVFARPKGSLDTYVVYPILDENNQPTGKYDWNNAKKETDAVRARYTNIHAASKLKAGVNASQSNKFTGAAGL